MSTPSSRMLAFMPNHLWGS